MRRLRRAAAASPLLAACFLSACAPAPPPAPAADSAPAAGRTLLEKTLARSVSKGDWDRFFRTADSAAAGEPVGREIALYWKAVAWLYRDRPDSAIAILESQQGKWSAGLRKVHAALLLKLAREVSARVPARPEEPAKPVAERTLQDRLEALERESSGLRAENQRLETEKEKYQRLLKDLETIR